MTYEVSQHELQSARLSITGVPCRQYPSIVRHAATLPHSATASLVSGQRNEAIEFDGKTTISKAVDRFKCCGQAHVRQSRRHYFG